MRKRGLWREIGLLCLPIVLLASYLLFPRARNLLPPHELRMESVRLIPPTILERYQGYGVRLEVTAKAPLGNSDYYGYELADAQGKTWIWGDGLRYLEISNGGISSYYDGRFMRTMNYRCALDSDRIFDGDKPVVLSWYERKDQKNTVVRDVQRAILRKPDFALPPLQKPEEMPFTVSRVQWVYDATPIRKSSLVEAKLHVWCGNTVYETSDFLQKWHFYQGSSIVGQLRKLSIEQWRSERGDRSTAMNFFYEAGQKATSVRGRLSVDDCWPIEITVELPASWQSLKEDKDLKFQTRIADLLTKEQLFERSDFWRMKAEGNTRLKNQKRRLPNVK